jgi:hypothetical protein
MWDRWVQDGSGDGEQGVGGVSEAITVDRFVYRRTPAPKAKAPHLAAAHHGSFLSARLPPPPSGRSTPYNSRARRTFNPLAPATQTTRRYGTPLLLTAATRLNCNSVHIG